MKCRILSKVCFTSDVMYKEYKRLVYTHPDLLARICKVNLSNAKKIGLICFARICFRGLIYCDQEPLWLLSVIEDVCYFLGVHITRHSKSNPIELNFNRTQSNSIGGLSSIEFGNRTKSNSPKRKKINRTQSNVRFSNL